MEKNLPAMWETWVSSLDWEDPLEKEMVTHSSILAWITATITKLKYILLNAFTKELIPQVQ